MCAFIWATMTKFQRLGSLHTDIYFSQSWMLAILRSRPQQILCLVRTHCSGLVTVTSHDGRSEEALSSLFYKGNNSINEGSTLVKYWPPKVSLANTIILGVGFSVWILRGKKHSDHRRLGRNIWKWLWIELRYPTFISNVWIAPSTSKWDLIWKRDP